MTRVVVVEDDRLTRDLLTLLLGLDVDVVAAFAHAEAAMRWTGWLDTDVLVTDLRLRAADGVDLARWVRERWLGVRRVCVTGADPAGVPDGVFDAVVSKTRMMHDDLLAALGMET